MLMIVSVGSFFRLFLWMCVVVMCVCSRGAMLLLGVGCVTCMFCLVYTETPGMWCVLYPVSG